MVIFTTSAIVTMQLDIPPKIRGRISGLFFLIFTGTTPIGAPTIGWIAQLLGGRTGLLTGGLITIFAAASVALLLTRHERRKDRQASHDANLGDSSRRP